MKRLAVLNWSGHGNFGDELFNDAYKTLFRGWDISLFTNSNIDFDVVNRCDLFCLGGGELIQRGQLFIPPIWTNRIKPEIPKIALGCGVNAENLSQIKPVVIDELANFRYIGLRDRYSVEMLSKQQLIRDKVGLFYDLAFSLDFQVQPTQERLAVIVPTDRKTSKYDRGVLETNFVKNFAKYVSGKLPESYPVVMCVFGSEDNRDWDTCSQLAELLPNPYRIVQTRQEILDVFASCSVVYSCRLHGIILANIFRKRYGFYPYHWKLNRVDETLLGCEPYAIKAWQRTIIDNILNELGL